MSKAVFLIKLLFFNYRALCMLIDSGCVEHEIIPVSLTSLTFIFDDLYWIFLLDFLKKIFKKIDEKNSLGNGVR